MRTLKNLLKMEPHPGSSVRDPFRDFKKVTFSGVKFVTSIWGPSKGHDWKKLDNEPLQYKSNHSLRCPCQTLVGVTYPDIDASRSRNCEWKIEILNAMVPQ